MIERGTVTCPNAHLSHHRENVVTDHDGNCLDCGRRIATRPKRHRSDNRRHALHTQIVYNGAPE